MILPLTKDQLEDEDTMKRLTFTTVELPKDQLLLESADVVNDYQPQS